MRSNPFFIFLTSVTVTLVLVSCASAEPKQIHEYPDAAAPLSGNEYLPISQSAAVRRISVSQLLAGVSGGGAGLTNGDKGDITVSSSGAGLTIDNKAVSLAKLSDMATASVIGRNTAGTGTPEILSMSVLKTMLSLSKGDVGLGNVNNTSDAAKPISDATQSALDAKASASTLSTHIANVSNPHNTNKSQVGLGNVDNTRDQDKPVSQATQTALDAIFTNSNVYTGDAGWNNGTASSKLYEFVLGYGSGTTAEFKVRLSNPGNIIHARRNNVTPQLGFFGATPSAQLSSPDLGTLATTFGLASGTPTFSAVNLTGVTSIAHGGNGTASPGLIAGTGITLTGTWPTQTITATGGGGSIATTTAILKGDGSGGAVATTPGTDYTVVASTPHVGDVPTVTATSPGLIVEYHSSLSPAFHPETDGSTITITCDPTKAVQNNKVTLGGNRILAFAGVADGMTGVLKVKQDGTGSRTLALPSGSKVVNGGSGGVTLSTAANSVDILTWVYDGTNYFWTYGANFN